MLRQITGKEIQRKTHVYCRVTSSIFHTRKCKEPTCWTDYKIYNLMQPCALRC